ncbi:glycoside hydrolase family 35 protein [Anopheles sinensis]|uniref:Glycoside hydrolase family 35 protein n=1 Tax=Anopheles sinensis TaxID=74873 RepID=A0A084WGM6_ANOSI|nr:glycoside hydrolase family 35 protein [Anopheles sinensis]
MPVQTGTGPPVGFATRPNRFACEPPPRWLRLETTPAPFCTIEIGLSLYELPTGFEVRRRLFFESSFLHQQWLSSVTRLSYQNGNDFIRLAAFSIADEL